ncbi:MAG: hypothetical protein KKE84_05565 [Gammaproteobacteria bacterium]|nr:hypothetical protein [Gammaproteobacteria bacterium]
MTNDTQKPAETKPATPTAAARTKPAAAKPVARARTASATAPAVRSRAPATARRTTAAAKKTATRPAVARKSPPVKKAAHEPAPFVAKDNKAGKPAKAKKAKLVRDSFTMPDGEYALIAALKKRCLDAGVSAKKSEILRAAVANLAKLSDASVLAAVRRLEVIKTGRPAKGAK